MEQLWIATCEIRVEPGDLPSGSTLAFSNIVTWGKDQDDVLRKIKLDLEQFRWELIGFKRVAPVDPDRDYGELNDLIDQAEGNPEAILLGRFFSYTPE